MKLLLITSTFPVPNKPHQGVFNGSLVQSLSQSHDIRVIAPIPWTERIRTTQKQSDDLKIFYPTFYYPPRFLRSSYGYWYWHSIRTTFRMLAKNFTPDVVMGYWAHPDSYAAVVAAGEIGVPSIVMVGGTDIRILAKRGLRRIAIQSVLKRANQVVAFSKDLANHISRLGIPSERIQVLYRGVDRTIFFPGDRQQARKNLKRQADEILVLWVGRFVEVKNPMMAIHVLAALKEQFGARLKLVMIGEGPLRSDILKLMTRLGLEDQCELIGAVEHHELADWYRASNLTVLTSLSEGVPNVLLESIACDTSFVSTNVGGVSEIADSHCDSLVDSQDVIAFQNAVAKKLQQTNVVQRSSISGDVNDLGRNLTSILERL